VTGFILQGFGTSTSSDLVEGPPVGFCGDANSGFYLLGDISTSTSVLSSGNQVSNDAGLTWTALLEAPAPTI